MMDKLSDDGLLVDGRKLSFEYRLFPVYPDYNVIILLEQL